jgi:drug/metabolite transporter (DMT)-like permease
VTTVTAPPPPAGAADPPRASPVRPRALASGAGGMILVGSSVGVSAVLAAAALVALARARRVPLAWPRGREWLWLAGLAATGLVLFNVAIVRGVAVAQPAMVAVAVACAPVLLGVLGPLLQRQAPQRRVVAAAVIVTLGAATVESTGRATLAGLGWVALALGCEAAFTLLAVPVLGRHGAWGVSVHSVWLGAAMFAVLALITEGPAAVTRLSGADLGAVVWLAAVVTVAAFVLWYSAVAALGPARAGLLTGIAPVSAALSGIITGSRAPTIAMWAGMASLAVGLRAGARARRSGSG